jgi:hypothetical protein
MLLIFNLSFLFLELKGLLIADSNNVIDVILMKHLSNGSITKSGFENIEDCLNFISNFGNQIICECYF